MAFTFEDSNVKEIIESGKPVVIDFWAQWCGPCRSLAPIVEELAKQYEGQAVIGKCDIEEQSEMTDEYGITTIPTLLFFKDGKMVERSVGSMSKSALEDKIKNLIG